MNKAHGFSLLELVITLVIVGILAVTVIPKLFGTSTFAGYAVRDQLITQLRLAQIRALHDNSNCYSVLITATQYGIPTATTCAASFDPSDNAIDIESGVTVTIGGSSGVDVQFDNMGRPVNGDCDGGCDIAVVGQEGLVIRVESEGYIHAL
jgi:MSHA pilin protein MshC